MSKNSIRKSGHAVKHYQVLEPLVKPSPLALRFDLIDAHIDVSRHNIDLLNKHIVRVVSCLHRALGGYASFKTRFFVSKKPPVWTLTLGTDSDIAKIIISAPIKHVQQFKGTWCGGKSVCRNYRMEYDGLLKEEWRGRLVPTFQELFELGQSIQWRPNSLGILRIRNPLRLYWAEYSEIALEVAHVLNDLGFTLRPRRVELAVDCLSRKTGTRLRKALLPQRLNPDHMHHWDKRAKRQRRGPNPRGGPEYHGYRPKTWWNDDPTRPRGGRLVYHGHVHAVPFHSIESRADIYRLECQFHRDACSYYMKRWGAGTLADFMEQLPNHAPDFFRFAELDLPGLRKAYPIARDLPIDKMTAAGRVATLLQNGLNREQIDAFLTPIDLPPVRMLSTDHPGEFPREAVIHDFKSGETRHVEREDVDWRYPAHQSCHESLWVNFGENGGGGNL